MASGNKKKGKTLRRFRGGGQSGTRVANQQSRQGIRRKQEEIKNLICDLADKGIITNILNSNVIKNSVRFGVRTAEKFIKLRFVVWEQEREKDSDYTDSQFAKFVLRYNENINDIRVKVLKYIEGIDRGFFVERLYSLSLEELVTEKDNDIINFHKTGSVEDKKKKDFKIYLIKYGRQVDLVLQVKSSKEALVAEREDLLKRGIAGSFYRPTNNIREDIDEIKLKCREIVRAYKEEDKLIYM